MFVGDRNIGEGQLTQEALEAKGLEADLNEPGREGWWLLSGI
jgi:hypothetical protein